jgi:hypothetical protein
MFLVQTNQHGRDGQTDVEEHSGIQGELKFNIDYTIRAFQKNAGPRDGDVWLGRLQEEFETLIKLIESNKEKDADWFRIEANEDGTRWFGKCWYYHNMVK